MAFNPRKPGKGSKKGRQDLPSRDGAKRPSQPGQGKAAPARRSISALAPAPRATAGISAPGRAQLGLEGTRFPAAWVFVMDELVTSFVKTHYSPKESWKDKPFSKEDVKFFFRGIEELSELFTDERPQKIPAYFQHPRFRSAYLLYFLPLQAAKFITLFDLHPAAVDAAIEHGRKSGAIRIVDLGAGPGTASIAALLSILDRAARDGTDIPPIELTWVDTSRAILEDGKKLVESLCDQFPRLRGKAKVELVVEPWWKALKRLPEESSLVLMGNVLNEAAATRQALEAGSLWSELFARAGGGGVLMVEPAAKQSSQLLSRLRDGIFENQLVNPEATSLWGPCLHAEKCPLAEGRDWCHFSVPVQIPGRWFKEISESLGSERLWAKFSYVWFASPKRPAPPVGDKSIRRVVSDPLRNPRGGTEILLCEPEEPFRMKLLPGRRVMRGDLIKKFASPAPGGDDRD